MFTSESFLPLMVAPSDRSHIMRRISATERSRMPISRCWMNHAFSTARVASSITLMPRARQKLQTSSMFCMLTGCPPARLTVTATQT